MPRWLSWFKVIHYNHFLLCKENAAWDMQWRYREKWIDQEHHEKLSFLNLAKFWMIIFLFCFFYEKMLTSIPMLLVVILAHVRKRSNSCSQMFSKTDVLKNFAIFAGKSLWWSLFLIKFQEWMPASLFEKKLQRRCFSVNIANSFFIEDLFIKPFWNFYLMIDNWCFRVIFCYCKIRQCNSKNFPIDRSFFFFFGI